MTDVLLGAWPMQWWPWAAIAAASSRRGLGNGIETGLYRLNRIRLRLRAEAGDRRAAILLRLLADLRGMIIVCLIWTSAGTFMVTAAVRRWWPPPAGPPATSAARS